MSFPDTFESLPGGDSSSVLNWRARGAHMHSSRDGVPAALVNECGALAGTLTVSPARAVMVRPRNVTSTSPSKMVNISSKSCQ